MRKRAEFVSYNNHTKYVYQKVENSIFKTSMTISTTHLQNQLAGHNMISRMARHTAFLQGLTIGKDKEEWLEWAGNTSSLQAWPILG